MSAFGNDELFRVQRAVFGLRFGLRFGHVARRTLAALVIALSVVPLARAADTGPKELDSLDRRAELIGWEAVGRLDMRGRGTCSGALIANDLVLTAAHCVVDSKGLTLAPKDILFRAGLRNGDAIAASYGLAVAVPAGYALEKTITAAMVRRDVALIRLATPIPTALARPFAIHSASITRGELAVASYGRGRNAVLSVQRACNVLNYSKGLFDFDCDVTFGSSGAPVFALEGGRRRIVSVVSSMSTLNGRTVGHGMSLLDVVSDLKRQIATGAPAQVAKPATPRRIMIGNGTSSSTRSVGNSKFVAAQ